MKNFISQTVMLLVILLFSSLVVQAQNSAESEIKKLEELEKTSMLKGDKQTLLTLWSANYIVNNPENVVVNVKQIQDLMSIGRINYRAFDRVIEKIAITDNTAVVMGHEVITPEEFTDDEGKIVTRRYTNVWQKTGGKWQLIARQATNLQLQ